MNKKYLKILHRTAKSNIQKILLSAGKQLWDTPLPQSSNIPLTPQTIKSILFLRQDGKIGDYIVSSFMFREIKKANPNIKIGVICTTGNIDLFQKNIYIDDIHPVKPKSILSYYKTGKSISGKYDIVIDPTIFIRNRDLLLIRTISAKYNIGYLKASYKLFNINIEDDSLHFSDVYKEILNRCGLSNIDTTYDIPEDQNSEIEINKFLNENNLTEYIAVNFFGAANSRKINEQNIEKYLQYFHQSIPDKKIVLLTYPAVTNLLILLSDKFENIFIFSKTNSIFHSISLIKHANLVISPDTAIIHIASGFNKPIIGLYKDNLENLNHWHPKSINNVKIILFKDDVNEITPDQLQLTEI